MLGQPVPENSPPDYAHGTHSPSHSWSCPLLLVFGRSVNAHERSSAAAAKGLGLYKLFTTVLITESIGNVTQGLLQRQHAPHPAGHEPRFRTDKKASLGSSTLPSCFILFFPSLCRSRSFLLREMSPPYCKGHTTVTRPIWVTRPSHDNTPMYVQTMCDNSHIWQ